MKQQSNLFLIAADPTTKQDFLDHLVTKLAFDKTKDFKEDYDTYLKLDRTQLTCELETTPTANVTEYVYILYFGDIKLATSTVKVEKYGERNIFIHEELKVEDDFKDPQFINPSLIDHDYVPPKAQLSGRLFDVNTLTVPEDLIKELKLGIEERPRLNELHIKMGLLNKDGSLSEDLPKFVKNKLQPVLDSLKSGNTPSPK